MIAASPSIGGISYALPGATSTVRELVAAGVVISTPELLERFGFGSVCVAVDETPYDLALSAARALLDEHDIDPDSVDAVIYGGAPSTLSFATRRDAPRQARALCGFGRAEKLTVPDMIDEKYRGIRPAPGYPACPDHTEKDKLFALLDVTPTVGITLTESHVMLPAASVCGWYLNHPAARYFSVGRIGEDQVVDYAARKGISKADAERFLQSNLGY